MVAPSPESELGGHAGLHARVPMVVAGIRAVMGEMESKEGFDIDSGGSTGLADSLDRGEGKGLGLPDKIQEAKLDVNFR